VQEYAEILDVLPPIEVNQHNEIIDGWHRWTAHKKVAATDIDVVVTETESDVELLELAIERNAKYGLQLSLNDKKDVAHKIYNATPESKRKGKKAQLAQILSVSERTVQGWLSRVDKDSKEKRDKRIFDLWLACHTQEEIADSEGVTKETVSEIVSQKNAELQKSDKFPPALHQVDFELPLYNIWKQQTKTDGSKHFGNSEVRWLDNLLYLHTQPFDVVVDPFAGGGSTIELCKKRMRRYWVSDRKPVPERDDIRQHDVVDGLPSLPRWKDVKLVYLDPPYWKQAEGAYSQDPNDFGNMELPLFNVNLSELIKSFASKLSQAYIALIIQPTQWKSPNREFTDHVGDMLRMVDLPVDMRYSVPYESQQCTAQMVEWAKQNRKCLVLTREIIVWRAG